MGNNFSDKQQEFRRNQEYIAEMSKIKLERQIEMRYEISRRQKALEIAKGRELFFWLSAFYGVTLIGSFTKFRRLRNSSVLTPLVPITFIWAYYCDLAYGTKTSRIISEAEMIMNNESDLLEWPCEIPSVSEIDQGRDRANEFKKIHPQIPLN